jgi:hypothetical protein
LNWLLFSLCLPGSNRAISQHPPPATSGLLARTVKVPANKKRGGAFGIPELGISGGPRKACVPGKEFETVTHMTKGERESSTTGEQNNAIQEYVMADPSTPLSRVSPVCELDGTCYVYCTVRSNMTVLRTYLDNR